MLDEDEVCVLVSASCKIAWGDLNHGALWLCPSGILRVPLEPGVVAQQVNGPTVDPNMPWEAIVTRAQIDGAARRGGGFAWYPQSAIMKARFEPGPTTNALHLELRDRIGVKFLWLAIDGGRELVEEWFAGRA